MEALAEMVEVHWTIVTGLPEWFFRSSLTGPYTLHPLQVDAGPVQHTALDIDLPATLRALDGFYGAEKKIRQELSALLRGCQLVICDIAPMGLAAARSIDVPSVLIENFTWDWIYEQYLDDCPEFGGFIPRIRELCTMADYHIRAEPACTNSPCDLHAAPVSRKRKNSREEIRLKLKVQPEEHLVLVSMGGEGISRLPMGVFAACPGTVFAVAGLKEPVTGQENLRVIRRDSEYFYPDLVGACDAVVGKVGYSTLAEVYHAGVPFGYVARPDFRESGPLVDFIRRNMAGSEIPADDFNSGAWIAMLPQLIAAGGEKVTRTNGADQCAGFIASLLDSGVDAVS